MPLHILKLCVGVDTVDELTAWQASRLADRGRVFHVTRMRPRRSDEVLAGGSIYWVIRRFIQVRQAIRAIETFADADGIERCRLVFDPQLVLVRPVPRRPFQGWRYLKAEDAPPDFVAAAKAGDMPEGMRTQLAELCLL